MKNLLYLLVFCMLFSVNQAKAGIIATDTSEPLLITNMQTENLQELKSGEGRIIHVFGLVDTGFASVQDIAGWYNINRIHHVDVRKTIILGCGVTKVIVYGE